MIVDLGTGDGRAVLDHARAEPGALVIGVDAAAAGMAETSRRAVRRGPSNALFLAEGAERLPDSPLAGRADIVTVTLPWGSLLRGVVGLDRAALAGVAAVVRVGGRVEVLASVVPSDGIPAMDCLDESAGPAIHAAWRAAGLELTSMRPATPTEIAGSGSTWARRLRANGQTRPVWVLEGYRTPAATGSYRFGSAPRG